MTGALQLNQRTSGAPALARPRDLRQYLAFVLEGETFAMDIRFIKEVIQYEGLTQVPLMPPFVRGVINLRGSVVPVLDLSIRFGHAPTTIARRTCVVIVEVPHEEGATTLGVMVDHVNEVLEIGDHEIDPAPSFGTTIRPDFIQGVGKVAGRFVILLEVVQLLSVDELASLAARDAASA